MAHQIAIPKLGLTMTEGTVTEWLKSAGAVVTAGEPLFTLVTDKIEAEIEAEADGVLHPAVAPGTTAACGSTVGYLLADDETPPPVAQPVAEANGDLPDTNPVAAVGSTGGGDRRLSSPNARRVAAELGVDISTIIGSGPDGAIVTADVERAAAAVTPPTGDSEPAPSSADGIRWTPVARRLADRLGLDGHAVAATGPGGRITLDDVIAATNARPDAAHVAPATPTARKIPLTGMRKLIAERMQSSLRDTAQLTLGTEAKVDRLLDLRAELKQSWGPAEIPVPSVSDIFIKAVAIALHDHPRVNARLVGDTIEELAEVHIGLAVDVPDGLLVPVVRHADLLALSDIAAETARLGAAARDGTLSVDELEGSTFTLSNLGTAGIDFFTPILNPPNVALLGVGRIRDAGDGHGGDGRHELTLSLTIDHRVLDGAPAARFLGAVRELIESPYRLLASQ